MPLTFYDVDSLTLVRVNMPIDADVYPNGKLSFLSKMADAKETAQYSLINISSRNDEYLFLPTTISKTRKSNKTTLIDKYVSLYNGKWDGELLSLDDDQGVMLFKLQHSEFF